MASIEYLQERIAKAEETISKKTNTIAKKEVQIQKKMDKIAKLGLIYEGKKLYTNDLKNLGFDSETANEIYWLECDIEHLEDDIYRGNKEIEEKQESINDYRQKLQSEIEKANSRNVPAIIEFLDAWKDRVKKFYMAGIEEYYAEYEKYCAKSREADEFGYFEGKALREEAHKIYEELYLRVHGTYEYQTKTYYDIYMKRDRTYTEKVKVATGDLEFCADYVTFRKIEEAVARLEKELTAEYNRKYDFIIERTNEIVGTITDATNLKVGAKQDLNGFIIGTNGTASVQTIGAGGYNDDVILDSGRHGQCFHYRTLINRVN